MIVPHLISNLQARNSLEGPAVVLSWDGPSETACLMDEEGDCLLTEDEDVIVLEENPVVGVIVVRKKFGYPENINDGSFAFKSTTFPYSGSFSDRYREVELYAPASIGATTLSVKANPNIKPGHYIQISSTSPISEHFSFVVSSSETEIEIEDPLPIGFGIGSRINTPNIEECTPYYYSIFTDHEELGFASGVQSQVELTTGSRNFFKDELFRIIPEVHRRGDGLVDPLNLYLALEEYVDGEEFNIDTDGTYRFGPLERYLRVIGLQFDQIKSLIDCIGVQRDIELSQAKFLSHLARFLGIEFNREITTDKQRRELRDAVQTYKTKGTWSSVFAFVSNITDSNAEVKEWLPNVLCTNSESNVVLGFTNDEQVGYGTYDDVVSYISDFGDINSEINPANFTVFLDTSTTNLDEFTIRKLESRLPELTPAGSEGFIQARQAFDDSIPTPIDDHDVSTADLSSNFIELPGDTGPYLLDRLISNPDNVLIGD